MHPTTLHALAALVPFAAAAAGVPLPPGEDEPTTPFLEDGPRALPGVTTTCGGPDKDYILEVNGGGLLAGDFDSDGDADLVVVDGSTLERVRAGEPGFPPVLQRNDGSGVFAPAGGDWTIAPGRWGMGGAVGDLDGDGHPDLVITEWGADRVLLNRGGQGFREITAEAGLRGERWGASAALLDHDLDGDLDLAVVNYLAFREEEVASRTEGSCVWKGIPVMCGPEGLSPVHDQLYEGAGDGTFTDVSIEAGFRPREAGYGLGITTLDLDVDGDTDLYVSNDSTPNHLWRNRTADRDADDGEDPVFQEVGMRSGVAHDPNGKEQAGMGIAVGDLNGDGSTDLFVTNFSAESNTLYLSRGRGFRDGTDRSRMGGHSLRYLGWGTAMEDFDLDGDLDLAVFNGHVYPQAQVPGTDTSYAQPDFLYRNTGGGTFTPEPLSDAGPTVARACVPGDFDGDGRIDLVVIEMGGALRFLRNRAAPPGGEAPGEEAPAHWLVVRLAGRGGNTAGLGARVRAVWSGGERTAEIRTAGGYQAAVLPEAHFGLGGAQRVQRLEVRFPSGREVVWTDVEVDRVLVIEEPAEPEGSEEPEGDEAR